MKSIDNWIKKIRNTDDRTYASYLLLGTSFILSQNFTWRFILSLPNIENNINVKSCSLYQVCASSFFVFVAIFLTSDGDIVFRFFRKHPVVELCVNKILYVLIVTTHFIFALLFFLLVLIFLPEDFHNRVIKARDEIIASAKEEASSSVLSVRILQGVLYFIFLMVIFTLPFSAEVVSVVAEVVSTIVSTLSFILVLCNVNQKYREDLSLKRQMAEIEERNNQITKVEDDK